MDLHGIVSKIVIDIHGSNFKTHEELWNKTLLAVPELGTFISKLKGENNGDKHKRNERFNDFVKLWGDIFALQIGKHTAHCRIIQRYRNLFGETLSKEFKRFMEPLQASVLLVSTPAELHETETNTQSGMDDQLIVEQV